ncbi:MAG: hypothetical protein M3371_09995, partial [Acidobacteriota bacterium]|nr:hypothetical protein [Acidobacteriota bacterium]
EHSRSLYSQFYPAEFIAKLKRSNVDPSADVFELLIQQNFVCASSVMLKKTLFDKVGLFNPDAAPADDYDLWLRCLPEAKIGYLAEPLIEYHIHASNFSHNFTNMVEKIIYVLRRSAERHSGDGRRLKQLGDSLIPCYRLLLTELLEKRQYGLALRHTNSILVRGRRGLSWLYWIVDRDLLVTLCKSFVGRTDTRRSVFGEQRLDASGRRNNVS